MPPANPKPDHEPLKEIPEATTHRAILPKNQHEDPQSSTQKRNPRPRFSRSCSPELTVERCQKIRVERERDPEPEPRRYETEYRYQRARQDPQQITIQEAPRPPPTQEGSFKLIKHRDLDTEFPFFARLTIPASVLNKSGRSSQNGNSNDQHRPPHIESNVNVPVDPNTPRIPVEVDPDEPTTVVS